MKQLFRLIYYFKIKAFVLILSEVLKILLMMSKKLNKKHISIASSEEFDLYDIEYWKSKSPSERFEAIELMRQINFGYDPSTERLQRLLTVTQRT